MSLLLVAWHPLQYCSLKKGKSESIPTVARDHPCCCCRQYHESENAIPPASTFDDQLPGDLDSDMPDDSLDG